MNTPFSRKICVAPMMDWTDRHCRYFLRLISKNVLLYTEMVTSTALIKGRALHLLTFNKQEHPIALQLGGSDAKELAQAAKLGEQAGYDEINLNVGCPSNRVQHGHFGVCLMLQPELVRDCIAAMRESVDIPVTVKCRIGINKQESYPFLKKFVTIVKQSDCTAFIIHARNAWLQGLSPKENRNIPPLHYDFVYRLKQELPELEMIINGGIKTYSQIDEHLLHVDGVMLGREAYHNPYILSKIDQGYFNQTQAISTRLEIIDKLLPYIEEELNNGTPLNHITRHILGLFQSQPGARQWRRYLSEHSVQKNAGIEVIEQAIFAMGT